MFLFVGLGNPGKRYADTPHNAGFHVCDRFASRHRFPAFTPKFQGEFARGKVASVDVGLLKPQTFMNLSGDSVGEALRYLPVELHELVVVYDEMDIPAGRLRLRKNGGSGGHNGMKSILERTGSEAFPRIRVGIGRPTKGKKPTGHLLSKVEDEERARFDATIDLAVAALEAVLRDGFELAMTRFNGLSAAGTQETDTTAVDDET